jgi:phage baseplate assembly protein W
MRVWQPDKSIGVDIRLSNTGDLAVTSSGDIDLVGNITPAENVWQATILRLLTTLETYLFEDSYGTNLRQSIEEPMTELLQQRIKNQVNTTVLSDPRVKKITSLTITQNTNPQGYQISLGIITASGQSASGIVTIGG